MTLATLSQWRGFWEERLGAPVVIAGGAVRDVLRGHEPKDIDVFALGQDEDLATGWSDGLQLAEKPEAEWHKSEPFLQGSVVLGGVEHQVMRTPARTPDELLDTFDWSVSLFALADHGVVQRCDVSTIQPGAYLELARITFPVSTLRRGYRFSERFKMRLRQKDLRQLCEAVLALESKEPAQ